MFRIVDVQLKTVNVFRLESNAAGASPIILAFDDLLFPALMDSRSLIDSVLVALQPYAHCPVRVVASIPSEIVHDRLLLDHCPEADPLNVFAYYRGAVIASC